MLVGCSLSALLAIDFELPRRISVDQREWAYYLLALDGTVTNMPMLGSAVCLIPPRSRPIVQQAHGRQNLIDPRLRISLGLFFFRKCADALRNHRDIAA